MKKFITQVIIIALFAYMLEMFLPWWSIAIAGGLGGLFLRSDANFWAGFCGIGILWLSAALVIDITSSGGLADKVASLMHLNETLLIIVTCLTGALVGGMASYTGSLVTRRRDRGKEGG
ncbi:MAG TPA: hypothetical protein VKZ75_11305 [Cyclobacteriaceae bacterium]|nr:hypothetical protein [Cyclobacteriaceae bacterium]